MLWSEWTTYKYPSDQFSPDAIRWLSKWLPLVQSYPTQVPVSDIFSVIQPSRLTFPLCCKLSSVSSSFLDVLASVHIAPSSSYQSSHNPAEYYWFILVVATPARSSTAPGIFSSLSNLFVTVWHETNSETLQIFHPVGCNPNDTRTTVSCHMGACVPSNLRSAPCRFQHISTLYTIFSSYNYDHATASETPASSYAAVNGFDPITAVSS